MVGWSSKAVSALALAALLPVAVACGSGDEEAGDPASEQDRPPAGQEQPPPTGQQQAPQIEVDEEELRAFTEAQIEMEGLRGEYQVRLQDAEGQQEAQEIEQEANDEMVGIVEDHGFDVERYTQVARAIDTDPELRQRFMELREELAD